MTKADHVSVQTWKYFNGDTPAEALHKLADAIEGKAIDEWSLDGSISLNYSEVGKAPWVAGACFKYEGATE